ncbi:Methyl-accepting chemotaxis protein [Helicobacter heilmannii ASB1.4]|nr:Methyl-accepting chemotaxis protein [Helicobacter heilmannii ASB1.4]
MTEIATIIGSIREITTKVVTNTNTGTEEAEKTAHLSCETANLMGRIKAASDCVAQGMGVV